MTVKLFANNINHLTDARYFAAWGASWMCYNVSSLTITEIAAIREWVEGPKHIINVVNIDPSEAAAMLTNDAIDGYLTNNESEHLQIQELLSREVEAFILNPKKEVANATIIRDVQSSTSDLKVEELYHIDGNHKEVLDFIEQQRPQGIVLAGSEEEQVGFKSFDELDLILEGIEEKDL